MTPEERAANLQKIAEASVAAEIQTGCPAEVSCAQAIIETGWGQSYFDHNMFGIKDTDRYPGSQYVLTKEYVNGTWKTEKLAFEVYSDLQTCFVDHGMLVSGGFDPKHPNIYAAAFAQFETDGNLDAYVRGIAKHYATDPHYADQILQLMKQKNIVNAITAARSKIVQA